MNGKQIRKQALAVGLAACLIVPQTAFATEPDPVISEADTDGVYEVSTEEALRTVLDEASADAGEPTAVRITESLTLTEPVEIPAGHYVTLSGADGVTVSKDTQKWDAAGMITANGTLTLSNITLDGGKGTQRSTALTVVYVSKEGSLTVNEGSVIQNGYGLPSGLYAGGIRNDGTLTMNAGTIRSNTASFGIKSASVYDSGYGGGIYNAGTCTITGGSITGNDTISNSTVWEPSMGGGIYNAGMLTLNGGTISQNQSGRGGGIFNEGTLTMDGADLLITSNKASDTFIYPGASCGGGLYCRKGSATLQSGTISNNTANNQATSSESSGSNDYQTANMGDGGGVYISNEGGSFRMEGGSITKNRANGKSGDMDILRQGGGVYIQGGESEEAGFAPGSFTMTGGSIADNTATNGGTGVYVGTLRYFYRRGHLSSVQGEKTCTGPASILIGNDASITDTVYLPEGTCIDQIAPLTEAAGAALEMAAVTDGAVAVRGAEGVTLSEEGLDQFLLTGVRTLRLDTEANAYVLNSKISLNDADTRISLDQTELTYNGSEQKPNVTVIVNEKELQSGSDYQLTWKNQTNAGTASVTVTGINDYEGSIMTEYRILPKDISTEGNGISCAENDLTKGNLDYTYDGSAKTPSPSLIVLSDAETGKRLLRNTDFKLTYENNINPGTASVVVSGIGNYTGILRLTYTITGVNRWIQSGSRWWYQHADGSYTTNGWEKIQGKWYYFDQAGWMISGWQKINGKWYYFGGANDGVMKTSWQKISGKWYYFGGANDGVMKTGWQKISGKWYYFGGANDGVMKTGWQKISGKWYYFGGANDGVMKTGWQKIDGKWYQFNSSGAWVS